MAQNNFKAKLKLPKFSLVPYFMLPAAIVFFFLSQNAKKNNDRLQNEGTVIEATVTKKSKSNSDKYDDKYYIEYRYTYNYEEYTEENRVYEELWQITKINDTIPVDILITNPDYAQIHSTLIFAESEDYGLVAFALFFTGLMFIIIPLYNPIKRYLIERRKSNKFKL